MPGRSRPGDPERVAGGIGRRDRSDSPPMAFPVPDPLPPGRSRPTGNRAGRPSPGRPSEPEKGMVGAGRVCREGRREAAGPHTSLALGMYRLRPAARAAPAGRKRVSGQISGNYRNKDRYRGLRLKNRPSVPSGEPAARRAKQPRTQLRDGRERVLPTADEVAEARHTPPQLHSSSARRLNPCGSRDCQGLPAARRASMASQIRPSMHTPSNRSICWMPVGEVTLISVR